MRWVATTGTAAGDGLTPQTAFASVSEAIASLRSRRIFDGEIRVCTGTYRAPTIVLDYPVSLLGGFDCASGLRTANFARKGNYASASRFVHPAAEGLVLDVVAGVERALQTNNVVEGLEFAFEGPTAKNTVITVQIRAGAVTVRNCKIVGGSSNTTRENGAIALQLDGKNNAEILSNDIESVPTTAIYGNGFVGIYAASGTPAIRDNRITALATEGVNGALGIYTLPKSGPLSGASAIRGNEISLRRTIGTATQVNPSPGYTSNSGIGILSYSDELELRDNRITTEDNACRTDSCIQYGVLAIAKKFVAINNRVSLDDIADSGVAIGTDATVQSRAIAFFNAESFQIVGNALSVRRSAAYGRLSSYAIGLYFANADKGYIAFNSIQLGGVLLADIGGSAAALYAENSKTPMTFELNGNVFAAPSKANAGYGVVVSSCDAATPTKVQRNVFVGDGYLAAVPTYKGGECASVYQYPATLTDLAAALKDVATNTDDNRTSESVCAGADQAACRTKLFGRDFETDWRGLFTKGIKPTPAACALLNLPASTLSEPGYPRDSVDLDGLPRRDRAVAGAWLGECGK